MLILGGEEFNESKLIEIIKTTCIKSIKLYTGKYLTIEHIKQYVTHEYMPFLTSITICDYLSFYTIIDEILIHLITLANITKLTLNGGSIVLTDKLLLTKFPKLEVLIFEHYLFNTSSLFGTIDYSDANYKIVEEFIKCLLHKENNIIKKLHLYIPINETILEYILEYVQTHSNLKFIDLEKSVYTSDEYSNLKEVNTNNYYLYQKIKEITKFNL